MKDHPKTEKTQKKSKWYQYTITTLERGPREGEEIVKPIRNANSLGAEDLFRSQITPSARKATQAAYNEWDQGKPSQGGGFGDSYAEVVRAAQQGGQNSSRRIWKNESEKQKAKRAKQDWQANKELTHEQTELLIKAGVINRKP